MSRGNRNTIGTGSVAPVSGAGTTRANRNSHPDVSGLAGADDSERKDLPSVNSPNFLEKLREAVSVYMGKRGDPLDRGITVRDLDTAGLITVTDGYLSNPDSFNPIGSIGGGVQAPYTPDLSPPPTPTGFIATGAISDFIVEHDSPGYVAGNGHGRTNLYGATWVSGALPVFSSATKLTSFVGTITSYPTDPATTWRLWIKWETKDGVESVTSAGGVNGLAVTTAQDPSKLVAALTAQITASQLNATLGTRIDLIDGASVGSVNARITSAVATEVTDRTTAIAAEASARAAAIVVEANARASDISIEASARAAAVTQEAIARADALGIELKQRLAKEQTNAEAVLRNVLANNTNALNDVANIALVRTEVTQSYQAGIAAEAALRTTLEAKLTTEKAATLALITDEQTARATADSAEAAARLALGAKTTADIAAAVLIEQTARTTADSAEAALRTALAATVATNQSTALAGIASEATARASADSAEAAQRTALEVTVSGNLTTVTGLITTEATTRANADTAEAALRVALSTQILGADGTATTAGKIYQESLTRATADTALSQQITLLSAGAGEQFDWQTIWYFDAGIESWTGNGTPTASAGWLRAANQASGAYANSPAGIAADASKYGQVRLRIRKTGAPTFAGWLYWRSTTDTTWDVARRIALTTPTYDANNIGLITVTPPWSNTIDMVRVDLSSAQTATDYFEIDWVAVGRPSPGASSAQLYTEQTARVDADTALTTSISTLSSQVNNVTTGLPAAHSAIASEASIRATADTANATAISTLSSQVNDSSTGLPAAHSAISAEATTRSSADTTNATAITTLSSQVNNSTTGLPAAHSAIASEATTRASADTTNATAISNLSSQVNDASTGLPAAHSAITSEATTRASADTTNASAISTLSSQVNDAITGLPAAHSAIVSEASTRASADTTNATAISTLSSTVLDPATGLAQTRADLVSTQATLASATAAAVSDSRVLKVQSKAIDEATLRNVLAIDSAATTFRGTLALAKQELNVNMVEGISAEATARLALAARVDGNSAAILSEQAARVSGDAAEAVARTALSALVDANAAAVVSEQAARVTADAAEALARTTLAASVADNAAAITAEQSARSAGDSAEAAARTVLAARVTSAEGGIVTNAAAIVSEALARATAVDAVASDVTTLSSTVSGHTSAISTEATTRASETGALSAQYSVKLDVDGKVSGFGIASDTTEGSTFLIRADKIAFAAPSGSTAGSIYPFIIDTSTNQVAFDGASISTATIGNAAIQDAAIDNAKIASLSAAKITAGDLQVGEYIQSATTADYGSGLEPAWSINGSGEAVFNQAIVRGTVYATDGVFYGEVIARGAGLDMARMYYGNFEVYKSVPGVGQVLYKALSRVEFGVCVNAATVTIPGYFKSQPKIIVSPNSMQLYTPAYASQNQSIKVSATAPVETSTGSMVWQFTPTAQLVLASGSSSTVINQTSGLVSSNSWTSSTYTTVANTSSITPSVTIASNRGNGLSQYLYRTVRWRVEYWNGSAWITSGAFTTVNLGADTAASATSTATFAFPSPGAWQFRIYAEAYDTNGSVFGSTSYTAGSATITHSGASSHTTYSTAGGSVSYTHTYNNGTYTPTAPAQLDPVNTYSTVYSYAYQASGGSGFAFGQGRVTDPNGQSYDTGSTRTNITLSGSATKTKVSNTDANLSFTLFADGWTGSSAAGSAYVNAISAVTTVKLRTPSSNSTTPSNNFTFGSYGYSLSTATVLATGSLNWIAIGD